MASAVATPLSSKNQPLVNPYNRVFATMLFTIRNTSLATLIVGMARPGTLYLLFGTEAFRYRAPLVRESLKIFKGGFTGLVI